MAKCAICDKGAHFGNNVSHSHRRSNKMWKSNVKSVRVKTTAGGAKKMYVCTSCLRSGKVERRTGFRHSAAGRLDCSNQSDKLHNDCGRTDPDSTDCKKRCAVPKNPSL